MSEECWSPLEHAALDALEGCRVAHHQLVAALVTHAGAGTGAGAGAGGEARLRLGWGLGTRVHGATLYKGWWRSSRNCWGGLARGVCLGQCLG